MIHIGNPLLKRLFPVQCTCSPEQRIHEYRIPNTILRSFTKECAFFKASLEMSPAQYVTASLKCRGLDVQPFKLLRLIRVAVLSAVNNHYVSWARANTVECVLDAMRNHPYSGRLAFSCVSSLRQLSTAKWSRYAHVHTHAHPRSLGILDATQRC